MKYLFKLLTLSILIQMAVFSSYAQWTNGDIFFANWAANTLEHTICKDGKGGAFVVWVDYRNASVTGQDIYLQYVLSDGTLAFANDGIAVCTMGGNQNTITATSDEEGGIIICWQDYRFGTNSQVYAQKVDSAGHSYFGTNGTIISANVLSNKMRPILQISSGGDYFVFFNDDRNGNQDIYAQKIDMHKGTRIGAEIVITNAIGDQFFDCKVEKDGINGIVIAWTDKSNNNDHDIYMQRIDNNGLTQWAINGVNVSQIAGNQKKPKMVLNKGLEGGHIVYCEGDLFSKNSCYLYIDPTGYIRWKKSFVVATSLIPTGTGNFILLYEASTFQAYAIKFDVIGTTIWDKFLFSIPVAGMSNCEMISDNTEGFIVKYETKPWMQIGNYVIANKYNNLGELSWSTRLGDDYSFTSKWTSDEAGGCLLSYSNSNRTTNSNRLAITKRFSNGELTPTLPLNLLTFIAKLQDKTVHIAWQTTNEINTAHFNVQQSVDATNFNNVGKLAAKGGGNYHYLDYATNFITLRSPIYYRLQIFDKDGSFTYSKIICYQKLDTNPLIAVYPNPVINNLIIQFKATKAEKVAIQIIDSHGKIVKEESRQVSVGNVALSENTNSLPSGNYVLIVRGSNSLQKIQFAKQ